MSDMLDQLDKDIANEKTADLPEAPKTPVKEEASMPEFNQSLLKSKIAVAEAE